MTIKDNTEIRNKAKYCRLPFFISLVFLYLTSFSQTNDTIYDSRHSWSYFQTRYKTEYFDSSKHHFTQAEKLKIEDLLDHQLALINVAYWSYDNKIHSGQIICNQSAMDDLKKIFAELLQIHFPICQCRPISEFHFMDTVSMQSNNTTCFDFRLKTSKNEISDHSYGTAIDINPIQNPYKRRDKTEPLNRDESISTGRIRNNEETGRKVIFIFSKYGWTWGGNWRSLKDFMHFQKGL